jgi:hypothetical protein
LSEIPKNNNENVISEVELADAEEFVMSDQIPSKNHKSEPKSGAMDFTGVGNANNETVLGDKKERPKNSMKGVNLFGREKGPEKKVGFEEDSDSKGGEKKRHYLGAYQSQYRKQQFIEDPGSDDDSRHAEDDEFFDHLTNSEQRKDDQSDKNPFGFESTYSMSPAMKKSFDPFDKTYKGKNRVAEIQRLNLNFVHSFCNRNVVAYQKYKQELENFLNANEDGNVGDFDDPDGINRKLGFHLQKVITNRDTGQKRN